MQQASTLDADFTLFLNTAPGLIVVLLPDDPDYTVVAVSDAYLDAVRKPRPEVVGRSLLRNLPGGPHPCDAEFAKQLRASLRRVLSGKQADQIRTARQDEVSCSGERCWQLVSWPVRDADGSIRFVSHTAEDITERILAERKQAEDEARQAFLLKLTDAIRTLRDPEAIKSAASGILGEHLGVNRAFYAEVRDDNWIVEGRYEHGVRSMERGGYAARTYGRRIMAAYQAGERIVFRDTRTDPGFAPEEREAHVAIDIISAVGVPLIKDGNLAAILAVHCASPRSWREADLLLVEETAERTWAAVERARAEAAERASEGKYRMLFDSIDEGFCIIEILLDAQGRPADYRFLETNPIFERQTGLVNATGRTARDLVPDLESFWFETYGRVALTGEPTRFVSSSEPMGRSFDVFAFRVGEPGERHVAILFRDITSHERARTALTESESRFRHLADHAPVMVWVTEPDGTCTFLSRSWYEFTGQTEETGLGFGWLDATHPDDRPAAEKAFLDANAEHAAFRVEYRLRRYDGEYRWAIDAAAPRLGPNGEFLGYIGSVLDITDRKHAEEALRESEERFRAIVSQATAGIAQVDLTGRFVLVNDRYCAIVGRSREELLTLGMQDVTHPDDLPGNLVLLRNAIETGGSFQIEKRYVLPDGRTGLGIQQRKRCPGRQWTSEQRACHHDRHQRARQGRGGAAKGQPRTRGVCLCSQP